MLQTYSSQGEAFFENGSHSFGYEPGGLTLGHYLQVLKRRWLYFAASFGVVLILGAFVTAIQRPIYQSEGKVLVESQEIPTDLVQPTVTESANQRIQVIQQRIMTRDNLLALVKKYRMFVREQQWMSDTQMVDLMRQRTAFALVDLNSLAGRPGANTIAFTVSFQYEDPQATLQVTNDLLTLILSEDARNRTARATQTTEFLDRESQRLQAELATIDTQIARAQVRPQNELSDATNPAVLQAVELAKLKEQLVQESSIYSSAHPVILNLKQQIAAMERLIARTPSASAAQENSGLYELERKRAEAAKDLEDNNKKLEEARLGERLERDQQSERLQVIEQPVLPQKPVKPNRVKLLALSLVLAVAAGAGTIFAAESLDGSVRYSHQLAGVTNGRLIVSIPYIATRAEKSRRSNRMMVLLGIVLIALLAIIAGLLFLGPPIDPSSMNLFWLDHLSK